MHYVRYKKNDGLVISQRSETGRGILCCKEDIGNYDMLYGVVCKSVMSSCMSSGCSLSLSGGRDTVSYLTITTIFPVISTEDESGGKCRTNPGDKQKMSYQFWWQTKMGFQLILGILPRQKSRKKTKTLVETKPSCRSCHTRTQLLHDDQTEPGGS